MPGSGQPSRCAETSLEHENQRRLMSFPAAQSTSNIPNLPRLVVRPSELPRPLSNAPVPSEQVDFEPKRSQRQRRPSAHKLESDEYQASSRGSSRPPTPSESKSSKKSTPKSKKRHHGKRGSRPGRIAQPESQFGTAGYDSSPESAPQSEFEPGDSLLAARCPVSNGSKGPTQAEVIQRVSRFLGVDASKLPAGTLQKVLAEIPNAEQAAQASAISVEGGSAPAVLQSSHKAVPEIEHQPGLNPSHPASRAPGPNTQSGCTSRPPEPEHTYIGVELDEDTDTESESESEFVELGPGDSVSQRFALAPNPLCSPVVDPRSTFLPSRPVTPDNIPMDVDAHASDESDEAGPDSDSDSESTSPHPSKRPRLTNPSDLCTPGARFSKTKKNPPRSPSQGNLDQPPTPATPDEAPLPDLSTIIAYVTRLAQQASHSQGATDQGTAALSQGQPTGLSAVGYDLLAKVLGSVISHDGASLATSVAIEPHTVVSAPSNPSHTDLIEDSSEALDAEAARALGRRVRTCRKPTLSDFPGLPRRIASLAIPELLAESCAQGPYETFGTLCDMAAEVYERVWRRHAPNIPRQTPPHELIVLMVHRVSWFRGELKTRIREKVVFLYGFINPPRTRAHLRFNRKLVKKLIPNTFHCRDLQLDANQYEHPALVQCIAAGLFWGPDSIGMVYFNKFRPIPLPTVSTVLTTMQHCITEWKTGRFVAVDLNAAKQLKVYESHLKGLIAYSSTAPKRLRRFQRAWYRFAVDYAGTPTEDEPPYQATTQADRVRPDTPVSDFATHAHRATE